MTLQVSKISDSERDFWDQAVAGFSLAHPLNAYGWGKVREIDGWEPSYFIARDEDSVKGLIMVLHKKIPWTGFSIMYAPKGPLCEPEDGETIKALLEKLRDEAKRRRSIFLRIDPNINEGKFNCAVDPFVDAGFIHLDKRWTFWNSPRDVYRIDLTKYRTEEELYKMIDKRARSKIRKAITNGVTLRSADNISDLKKFYEIYKEISIAKNFMCRDFCYQKALWNEYIAKGNGSAYGKRDCGPSFLSRRIGKKIRPAGQKRDR